MKVVIAIDSFKGSLTSLQAGEAAAEGVRRVFPNAETIVRPVADGGEGTLDALMIGLGAVKHTVTVSDPLGRPIAASYGYIEATQTAVLEMSAAAGITLVSDAERNPLNTTTYGVGEMIADAIQQGCRHFLIGIGGSATNDGGVGMLQALGFSFYDGDGKEIARGGGGLAALHRIETAGALPALRECSFQIICDVTNPLCGELGCSAVYGPQKGATPAMVADMDAWLVRYAALTQAVLPHADATYPGTGAAGGMGFAFLAYLGGRLEKGIELVLRETHLEDYVQKADLVITGEGRLDGQTVMGKTPIGVARIAKAHGKPVIAFSGAVTKEAVAVNAAGIDAFFPILRRVEPLSEVMKLENAHANMADTVEQVFRLIALTH